jgi:hypothetical protein
VALAIDGETVFVDAADLHIVDGYNWRISRRPNGRAYARARVGEQTIYMHRLIDGTPAGMETDHRNGNGLDNRRTNLRTATRVQNSANVPKRRRESSRMTSRYKGVSWDRVRGCWRANARIDGRQWFLGRYADEADAARAYNAAALSVWGEFARLNEGV